MPHQCFIQNLISSSKPVAIKSVSHSMISDPLMFKASALKSYGIYSGSQSLHEVKISYFIFYCMYT